MFGRRSKFSFDDSFFSKKKAWTTTESEGRGRRSWSFEQKKVVKSSLRGVGE
jgi:hypothetical protein